MAYHYTMGPNSQKIPRWCPPLASAGQTRQRRGDFTAAALAGAPNSGQRAWAYPELLRGGRCKLVVVALEVGGRWSTEAASLIRQLAQTRSRAAPAALQTATAQAYIARWSALLTHAAQTAFAKSLLFEDLRLHTAGDGESPLLSDLLDLHTTPPDISRLPP